MSVCAGRACRGGCVKDDCLLLRLSRGLSPMDGDEGKVSTYVNGGLAVLDLLGWPRRDEGQPGTLADWRYRALTAERKLEQLGQLAHGPRQDIASGEVWPDEDDPEYLEWLVRRCRDLETMLVVAEELLERQERWSRAALAGLDDVIGRLIVEEHGPPPHRLREP